MPLRGDALIGAFNNAIALQPFSVQGKVGISVVAGLESLELRPGETRPSRRGGSDTGIGADLINENEYRCHRPAPDQPRARTLNKARLP